MREIRSPLGNKDIRGTTSPLAFSGGFTALLYSDQEKLSMDVATKRLARSWDKSGRIGGVKQKAVWIDTGDVNS